MTLKDIIYVESKSGAEHEIEFSVDCTIENDGIGSYEYWGQKCYDHGTDSVEQDGDATCFMVRTGKDGKSRKRKLKFTNEAIDKAISDYIAENGDKEYRMECESAKEEAAIAKYESRMEYDW